MQLDYEVEVHDNPRSDGWGQWVLQVIVTIIYIVAFKFVSFYTNLFHLLLYEPSFTIRCSILSSNNCYC